MSAPRLTSRFRIGDFRWKGVTDVQISKSIHSYRDTAVITLPARAVLGETRVVTADQFAVGQPVEIDLGWNGNLRNEFRGFVSRVNWSEPCHIECEGFSWLLRNRKNIKKFWATTTLREVLSEIVEGTEGEGIELHESIPTIPLKNLYANNASGTQIIDYLKGLFNGVLTVYFVDNVLYAGLTYTDAVRETVRYRLGWNTMPADKLKFRRADEVEVNVEIKYRNEEGKLITTSAGVPGGVTRTDQVSAVTDVTTMEKVAEAKLRQESYDGYEGLIETLLVPYVQHGYRAEVEDPRYGERGGVFFVESVDTAFGVFGTRRAVGVGIQLDEE